MSNPAQTAPPHQDDRLREQLLAEREEATHRRDALVQEMEAQRTYHAQEIDRCERVMHGCNAALEMLDPPKMAIALPDEAPYAQQQAAPISSSRSIR